MSIPDRCSNCKEIAWAPHNCKPRFEVRCEEEGYEWKTIFANDFDFAAEAWAEDYDNDDSDYFLAKGSCLTVEVKDSDGVIKKFEVTGETVPKYHARDISNEG